MIPQTIDQYQCGEFDLVWNRFHVAMGLYRGRSQLTSKCGKKKSDSWDAWCLLWSISTQAPGNMESILLYMIDKENIVNRT